MPDFDDLARKVLNLDVSFHWIEKEDRFWFKRETAAGDEFVLVDAVTGAQSTIDHPAAAALSRCPSPFGEEWALSPDRKSAVTRRDYDLWLRDLATGQERRLTQDGEPHFAYGVASSTMDTHKVARRKSGAPAPLKGILWSPDSRFIVLARQDLRRFPERLLFAEYVTRDGAYTHAHFGRFATAADPATPDMHLSVVDTRRADAKAVSLDPQALNDYAQLYFDAGVVWWGADGRSLFLLSANRGGSRYALNRVDLETGATVEILHETARFNVRLNPFDYCRPNVWVSSDGAEAIWYSERSGYGHLYLYDATTGELVRPLTCGDWVVFDLLRVDEENRFAYFTAATRIPGGHPYYRYLYRVSLEGGEPQLLTPEIADHPFSNFFGELRRFGEDVEGCLSGSVLSPSGRYFVDCYSTVEQPPEYVLRRSSGECVTRLLSSDASRLYADGWQPPERVVCRAADGITELHGVITRPRGFDPARSYPVIESMYPGPQGSFAPRTFKDQLSGGSIHHLQTFADAGFIVVALDARGTAHRSREFRDAFLGTEDVFGAADHVAAIRHLAAQRPQMDLTRVGVRGQSFGGYGALRAMLLFPDFFKVAVAATGPEGWSDFPSGISTERFFGVPAASAAAQEHYDLLSNARLAPRLSGRLLLIYGGLDENVPLKHAFTLIDAFIRADKDVDLIVMPESTHAAPREAYAIRRSVRYFIEHLARGPDAGTGE